MLYALLAIAILIRCHSVPRPLPTRTSTYANALDGLNIIFWTSVPVRDEFAIKVLSLYLDTDHSLFGAFEPELFVQDLISQDGVHCSSLLVNAMMYWACVRISIRKCLMQLDTFG